MSFRHAFQSYIDNPGAYKDIVLYEDDDVLIIKDTYPKALRHYLVIPRSPNVTHVHPTLVFQRDQRLYNSIEAYVEKAKTMMMDDLLDSGLLKFDRHDALATTEFSNTFIKAGVHSIPSLSNLHIHVITQDFYSPCLKHKKHYNSFTTDFFVEFRKLKPDGTPDHNASETSDHSTDYDSDADPVANRLEMDSTKLQNIVSKSHLRCLYCGENFVNKFAQLKHHLKAEFLKKFNVSRADLEIIRPNNL